MGVMLQCYFGELQRVNEVQGGGEIPAKYVLQLQL